VQEFEQYYGKKQEGKTEGFEYLTHTGNRTMEPLYDISINLNPRCINGERYTPMRDLYSIFNSKESCTEK